MKHFVKCTFIIVNIIFTYVVIFTYIFIHVHVLKIIFVIIHFPHKYFKCKKGKLNPFLGILRVSHVRDFNNKDELEDNRQLDHFN